MAGVSGASRIAVLEIEDILRRAPHVQAQGTTGDAFRPRGALRRGPRGPGGERELHFVAVIALLGRRHHRQYSPRPQAPQTLEGLLHVQPLPVELLFVGQVLPGAAAAQAEMGAERRLVPGGLGEGLHHPGLGELGLSPGDFHPYRLPGEGMLHENHQAIGPAQGLAAKGQLVYGQFQFIPLLKGGLRV